MVANVIITFDEIRKNSFFSIDFSISLQRCNFENKLGDNLQYYENLSDFTPRKLHLKMLLDKKNQRGTSSRLTEKIIATTIIDNTILTIIDFSLIM